MIFYFSGTGNTKWVAQQLAEATGERLCYIPDELKAGVLSYQLKSGERLGFCFPTHGWQPPRIVRDFIRRSAFTWDGSQMPYVFAVTTCGDNMGHAMRILNKELSTKRLQAQSQFAVLMPESNVCFSFLHLDTKEREREKIAQARERITTSISSPMRSSGSMSLRVSNADCVPVCAPWTILKVFLRTGSTTVNAPIVWLVIIIAQSTPFIGVI